MPVTLWDLRVRGYRVYVFKFQFLFPFLRYVTAFSMKFNNQDQFRTCNPVCLLFVIKSHVINRAEKTVLPERLMPWCVDDKKTRKFNVKRLELKQEIRTIFFHEARKINLLPSYSLSRHDICFAPRKNRNHVIFTF